MSIQRSDVSYLFSGLSGSSGSSSSSWLSDYASIKNGSYGKLMKAYYGNGSAAAKKIASGKTTATDTTESSKAYAKVQTNADSLKSSADKLLSKSLYEENDSDKLVKAVDSFVSSYNSVINSVGKVDDATVGRRAESLVNLTVSNSKSLQAIGITVNEDATLSVDKDKLKQADTSKIKSVFGSNGSYGYQASAQASLIEFAADHAASQSASYSATGAYSGGFSTGNLFSGYF